MKVDHVIPCRCCDHEPNAGDSVYYGMPVLKVTDVDPNTKTQFYTAVCPVCGMGDNRQHKSAYKALEGWNILQQKPMIAKIIGEILNTRRDD